MGASPRGAVIAECGGSITVRLLVSGWHPGASGHPLHSSPSPRALVETRSSCWPCLLPRERMPLKGPPQPPGWGSGLEEVGGLLLFLPSSSTPSSSPCPILCRVAAHLMLIVQTPPLPPPPLSKCTGPGPRASGASAACFLRLQPVLYQ